MSGNESLTGLLIWTGGTASLGAGFLVCSFR